MKSIIAIITSIFLVICLSGCLDKKANSKLDSQDEIVLTQVVEDSISSIASSNNALQEIQEETLESKDLIELNGVADNYFEDTKYNIKNFFEKVDSTLFWNLKFATLNKLDTSLIIKPINNILTIPTNDTSIIYVIKPFNEYGFDGEVYSYRGFYQSLNAHIVNFRHAQGFGCDLIMASDGKITSFNEFPYLSPNSKLILTCRIDAENIVVGTIEFSGLNLTGAEPKWGGWSDYSLLPIEAVWESDTTVLLKAEQYLSENDYYEQKLNNYIYGRLTIRN